MAKQRGPFPSELKLAFTLGATYLAFAIIWIVVGGQLALERAVDTEQLAHIELIKGLVFVVLSSFLVFGLSWRQARTTRRAFERVQATQEALFEAERRAVTGLFSSSVAHDCSNMTGVVLPNLELVEGALDGRSDVPDELRTQVGRARVAAERLADLCQRLRDAGQSAGETDRRVLSLDQVAAASFDLAKAHHLARGVDMAVGRLTPVTVESSPDLLQHVVLNLVLNAVKASPRGRVELRVRREGDHALLEVHDDGPGIPEAEREKVFEAFYTTAASGTGLGLYGARAGVRQQDGDICVAHSDLGGACLRVQLPVVDAATASEEAPLALRTQTP